MVAYSSGRPIGPDGNPLDEGPIGGLLAGFAPQQVSAPPENPAVLAQIAGLRQGWQSDVDAYNARGGNGLLQYGPFSPGVFAEQAMQPGMSGYFDVLPGGSIVPHMAPVTETAAQSGQSLGQLAGSIFPSSDGDARAGVFATGGQQYNIPNDGGGFFSLQDLFNYRQGGVGVQGVPSIGTYNQSGLSTNNWRLLGRGPGWIMRNGFMINTRDPAVRSGLPGGASNGNPAAAEHGSQPISVALGTGAGAGFPSLWIPGGAGSYYWPGADERIPRWGGLTT